MRASEPRPTNHREPREIQRGLPAKRGKGSSESVPPGAPAEHQDRAGLESSVACMDGSREQIQRPWVRHETDGKVRLASYEAASSSRKLFDQIVASVSEGLPVRVWSGSRARRSAAMRHQGCAAVSEGSVHLSQCPVVASNPRLRAAACLRCRVMESGAHFPWRSSETH
ncbi:MAG: hypothetical protein RLZZ179_570 [Verrucomicrobiota bacterium]|jgi:hypothetical protein